MLLEGLALWLDRPPRIAVSAADLDGTSFFGLTDDFGTPQPSVYYSVEVVERPVRRRSKGLGGVGDFRDKFDRSRSGPGNPWDTRRTAPGNRRSKAEIEPFLRPFAARTEEKWTHRTTALIVPRSASSARRMDAAVHQRAQGGKVPGSAFLSSAPDVSARFWPPPRILATLRFGHGCAPAGQISAERRGQLHAVPEYPQENCKVGQNRHMGWRQAGPLGASLESTTTTRPR
jgi:hypothetical protein